MKSFLWPPVFRVSHWGRVNPFISTMTWMTKMIKFWKKNLMKPPKVSQLSHSLDWFLCLWNNLYNFFIWYMLIFSIDVLCVCMCVCMRAYMCDCKGHRLSLYDLLNHCLAYFLTGTVTDWHWDLCSFCHFLPPLGLQIHAISFRFYTGAGDLATGPHAWMTVTFADFVDKIYNPSLSKI